LELQVTRKVVSVALVSLSIALLAGCAADGVRDDAERLMDQGDYEHAVQALEAGTARYPDSVQLRSRLVLARAQAQSQLIDQARAAESAGELDRAEALLRRATAFDGTAQRAGMLLADLQVARAQRDALQGANTLAGNGQVDAALRMVDQALKDNRRDPALLALQRRLQIAQRQAQLRGSQQGLAETRPISLDFRDANVRNVLEVVSRNSGINIVLDKDIKDQRITVYAKSVRFDDALDMILNVGQLSRKVLDSKTVLIYPNTPDKQREHQEQLVKVFYLANGDAKGAAAFLKSAMKLHEPYVDDRHHLLMLRDSLDNIQLAERLITLFDNPEPEVLLEAEVLEVSADRLTELGVSLPTQVTLTPLTLAGGTNLTLDSFPLHRGNVGVGLPAATINAKRTIGDVNTLANPKIRTRSGEKAKVLIGDKIPIITTTTTPGVAGFVSESVSYQDVGIKLDVEPEVFPDDDVAIKLNLEVSALGTETKTASGTIAYQISTRNASTLLRLHDGETQLLAGLISSDERASTAGLPGLADVPILGRLFSDQTNSHSKTELVLSITPHIVRGQPHLNAAESEAWVGTEMFQRLKPVGGRFDNEAPSNPAAVAESSRAITALPAPGSPASAPVPVASQGGAPHVDAGSPATIAWTAPASVKVGGVFTAQLQLRTGVPIGTLALSLRYPADLLGLVGFADSPDMPEAAPSGPPAAHNEPDNQGVIDLARVVANASDVPLSLVRVQFKALKAGDGNLDVKASVADAAVKVAPPPSLAVKIAP
jgi:general secretion pathway protein D